MESNALLKTKMLLRMLRNATGVFDLKKLKEELAGSGYSEDEIHQACEELADEKVLARHSAYSLPTCGFLATTPRKLEELIAEIRRDRL